jgi:hypothetical protein
MPVNAPVGSERIETDKGVVTGFVGEDIAYVLLDNGVKAPWMIDTLTPVEARMASKRDAHAHFLAGGTVLISEHGQETVTVYSTTTVHTKESISWDELVSLVDMWMNRHPNQRYYVI